MKWLYSELHRKRRPFCSGAVSFLLSHDFLSAVIGTVCSSRMTGEHGSPPVRVEWFRFRVRVDAPIQ